MVQDNLVFQGHSSSPTPQIQLDPQNQECVLLNNTLLSPSLQQGSGSSPLPLTFFLFLSFPSTFFPFSLSQNHSLPRSSFLSLLLSFPFSLSLSLLPISLLTTLFF